MHPKPCIICQISDLSQPEVWYLFDIRPEVWYLFDIRPVTLISDLWRVWLRICTYKLCTTSNSATIVQYNGWSFTFVPIHTGCWSIWQNKADRIVHGACLWVKKPAVYLFIFFFMCYDFFRNFFWCIDAHLFLFCKALYLVCNIIVYKNVSNGKERNKILN